MVVLDILTHMKPHKRIPRMSKTRTIQNQEYAKIKSKFLDNNPYCFVCGDNVPLKYRTVHHWAGRVGDLLIWVPGFRTCCVKCHQFIETHRNDSVKLGYRAPNNLFNRPSRVIPFSDLPSFADCAVRGPIQL